MIAPDVLLGKNVLIYHPDLVNLYGCAVGDDTRIGSFVEVQRGATIGARCKISSHSFVCEGVTIEDGVFVGHGVMFTNDIYPRATNADGSPQSGADWGVVPTRIRAGASLGSNATILAGVTVGAGALVGAGAVVTRDVPDGMVVAGVPARVIGSAGMDAAPVHRNGVTYQEPPAGGDSGRNSMIGIGVVGYGYWGPNLVRNFSENPDTSVLAVCDQQADRLQAAKRRYPAALVTPHFRDLLDDPDVNAVVIATPVSTHYELTKAALRAGKHVLVEKPLTDSVSQAEALIEEAQSRDLVLMVDHTFVYTGAVRKIHGLVREGALGEIYYYDSTRVNLGLFQRDVDVIWDLAVHDLAIMNYTLGVRPCAVAATGMSHVAGGRENIAYITVFFPGSLIAHINVNWLSPVKIRRTLIGGSRKMIVYDDMESSEKVKVYDRGITVTSSSEAVYQQMVGYRTGDMFSPQLDVTEALKIEISHFVDCIRGNARPITGGHAGLDVVRILEAATESMRRRGGLVELEQTESFGTKAAVAVAQ